MIVRNMMIHLPPLVPLQTLPLDVRVRVSAQKGRHQSGRSEIRSASLKLSKIICLLFRSSLSLTEIQGLYSVVGVRRYMLCLHTVDLPAVGDTQMICWCIRSFCKMEQSIARHFIFINNPAFLFRQCNNPSAGH